MVCTHKNNALSFLVSVAVARSKCIVFLFAFGLFLIAFVEKLVPEWRSDLRVVCYLKAVLVSDVATAFPEKQLLGVLWQIKNDTLAGLLILWVQTIALLEC